VAGHRHPNHEILSWRFEASNDSVVWIALREEFKYTIGPTMEQVDITIKSYFQYYKLFVYEANRENPGLRHFQLFVYKD